MDDLELLSRLRPADEDPDPVVLAKHRIALLNRATDPGARVVVRRWSMPRVASGAAVVAGITAVGLVVGLSGGHEPLPPGPGAMTSSAPKETAAVVLLANAATAAANTPAGTGEWAYTSTVTILNDTTHDTTHTLRMQVWEKTDGTDGLVREDRDGKFEEIRTGNTSDLFPPSLRHPTYRYLATLPTDPTALRDEIYTQAQNEMAPSGQQLYTLDQWAFLLIAELVRHAAPPELKAALYRVAATVPDVEYVDDVTDAAGRHGIGVAHTVNNAGDRSILIFDRTTYQVMGSTTETHDGMTGSQAVLATGLVANAGQTP
jgi:hypothetical protein